MNRCKKVEETDQHPYSLRSKTKTANKPASNAAGTSNHMGILFLSCLINLICIEPVFATVGPAKMEIELIKGLNIYASCTNLIWIYTAGEHEILKIWTNKQNVSEASILDDYNPKLLAPDSKSNVRYTWHIAHWENSFDAFRWPTSLITIHLWTKQIQHKLRLEPSSGSIICKWKYEPRLEIQIKISAKLWEQTENLTQFRTYVKIDNLLINVEYHIYIHIDHSNSYGLAF